MADVEHPDLERGVLKSLLALGTRAGESGLVLEGSEIHISSLSPRGRVIHRVV
jgi:hypothetical protein